MAAPGWPWNCATFRAGLSKPNQPSLRAASSLAERAETFFGCRLELIFTTNALILRQQAGPRGRRGELTGPACYGAGLTSLPSSIATGCQLYLATYFLFVARRFAGSMAL